MNITDLVELHTHTHIHTRRERHTRAHTFGLGMWEFNCRCWCCSRMIPCTAFSYTQQRHGTICAYVWNGCENIDTVRYAYMCAQDECCLISTIDSFNPALGVCVSWLDLTWRFFFYFKYIFILHFFQLCSNSSVLSKYLQTIILSTCNVLGSKRTMMKKMRNSIAFVTAHPCVFKRGENGVNVWTSNIFFVICIWFNFSRQFMRFVAFIPILEFKMFCNKNHMVATLAPKPFVNGWNRTI